jgi:hypothetical protein
VLARPAVVLTLSWKVVVEVCKKHRANGDVVVGSDENLDEPSILGASLARGKIGYEVCFSAATGKGRVDGGAPIGTLCRLFFGYQTARWNGSHHLDEPGGLIVEATLRFMESRQAKVACDALCADGGRILPDGWSNVLVQCEGRDVSISVRAYDVAAILATEGHPRHREAIAMAGTIDELSIALADAFARFGEECCAATCRLLEAMRTNGDNPRCG